MAAEVVQLRATKGGGRRKTVKSAGSSKPAGQRRSSAVSRAAGKDRRALLVALRNRIARDIDGGVPARDLASLSRRLMELSAEIEKIDQANSKTDDVSVASSAPDEVWNGS